MENINKFFGNIQIYIINLKDSIERKENILKQIGGYKNLHFVEAVDGRNPEKFYKTYDASYKSNINQTTPIYAAFCSHVKAIKEGLEQENEWICVLEDNVCFDLIKTKVIYTINDIINMCNKQTIECVQLTYNESVNDIYKGYFLKNGFKLRKYSNSSGTIYIINKNGIKKILNTITTNGNNVFRYNENYKSPELSIFNCANSYIVNFPVIHFMINLKKTYDINSFRRQRLNIIVQNATNAIITNFNNEL